MYKTLAAAAALLEATAAFAQPSSATHSIRVLTPEAAQKVVNAAMAECRKQGFQVAVAVVDRSGATQALLRDRFAGTHPHEVAANKAWMAVSFRTGTSEMAEATHAGQPASGLRSVPRFTGVGGGMTIEAAGHHRRRHRRLGRAQRRR